MKVDVVSTTENFRGLPYGFWFAKWTNWLMSANPDHYDGGEMFFLRGNLDYRPVASGMKFPRYLDAGGVFDRTNEMGFRIYEDTSLFVPVITSHYTLGIVLEGNRKGTEDEVRQYINKDIDRSGDMWATIRSEHSTRPSKIVDDLREFRVESPLFRLVVPKDSKLNKKQYMEEKPGIYDAVVGGYCLIIRFLQKGSYRINFGAKGRGDFYTNALYDVTVRGKREISVQDVSGK